ncbi:porin [Chromobacterium paludis]|uniref:Porin n=1 Tax=Chromobacterium paludis TaxID=2605945 RepID=A0A5C1DIH6_9NEIS|nr:porin [Chromobacterium paludis]QEL56585.1 porin [Chromobacterium paludis]
MNKKLIALALAALPAAAMADVTIYGTIKAGIEDNKTYSSSFGTNAQGKPQSGMQINDWTSSIGFKGSEDLGGGLKAIWQVESRLHMDGSNGGSGASSDGLGTRDTFIGLTGDWGKVRFGKLSNYANSDMELVDPGSYSGESVGGLGMFTRLDDRHTNALRFDSPTYYGFSYAFLYSVDEKRNNLNNGTGPRTNNSFTNIGLSYENAGYFGKYNYGSWGDSSLVGGMKDWHRLEAGYNANNIYVALGYQQADGYSLSPYYNSTVGTTVKANYANALAANGSYATAAAAQAAIDASKMKAKELALTGGYTFGAFTPYISYVKGYDVTSLGGTISNSGYDQFVLSLDYAMSKRTEVYTSYGHVNWKASGVDSESSFGVGLIHRF